MKKTIIVAAVAWMALGVAGTLPAAEGPGGAAQNFPEEWKGPAVSEAAEQGEVRSARRLLGSTVQGAQGDRLGEVSEVLLDVDHGSIAYLVVTPEAGETGQARIIPWRAVSVEPQTASLTADIDADRFAEAPEATGAVDRLQGEEIHRFYGVSPYWEEAQPEEAPALVPVEPTPRTEPSPSPQRSMPEAGETERWFE